MTHKDKDTSKQHRNLPTLLNNLPMLSNRSGFFITNPDRIRQGQDGSFIDGRWSPRKGEPFPPGTRMWLRGMVRAVRGWQGKALLGEYIETREELPSTKELNAQIPESEWDIGLDDKPRKPWAFCWIVYLTDESDGSTYTFCNSTYGQMLSYEELETKLAIDIGKGKRGIPVIELSSKPMPTPRGVKMRPSFKVVDYIGDDGSEPTTQQIDVGGGGVEQKVELRERAKSKLSKPIRSDDFDDEINID